MEAACVCQCGDDGDCAANQYCDVGTECDHYVVIENCGTSQHWDMFTSAADNISGWDKCGCRVKRACEPRLGPGSLCISDGMCQSGTCGQSGLLAGRCTCTETSQCGPGLLCHSSGHCGECVDSGDCLQGQFCNGLGGCYDQLALEEPCGIDDHCLSGSCLVVDNTPLAALGAPVCACTDAGDCVGQQLCSDGACLDCGQDSDCDAGETCLDGTCADCGTDGDCLASEYCAGAGECTPRRAAGDLCLLPNMCLSGQCGPLTAGALPVCLCGVDEDCVDGACNAGACVACGAAVPCPDGSYCQAPGLCLPALADGGPCSSGLQCLSGYCAPNEQGAGSCAQCLETAHCSADEFCVQDACVARQASGSPCTAGEQCASASGCIDQPFPQPGICACDGDQDCPAGVCAATSLCVGCETAADCGAGSWCHDASCLAQFPIGTLCTTPAQCVSGSCSASPTLPGVSICSCTSDDDCIGGVCADGLCSVCNDHTDCTASQWCANNDCVAKLAVGAPCPFEDAACASGSCVDTGLQGLAICTCASDSDCGAGYCDEGSCVQCINHTDCQPGWHCAASQTCQLNLPDGAPCSENEACVSGGCLVIQAPAPGICVTCLEQADCPNGYTCKNYDCAPQSPYLGPCDFSQDCLSGSCGAGGTSVCGCQVDPDCPGASVCETGTGLCRECVDSADCSTGQWCSNYKCQPQAPYLLPCTEDDACLSGQCGVTGSANKCGCTASQDCGDAVCDTGSHLCVGCLAHTDCAGTEWCNSDDACQPKGAYLGACTDDVECVSGACGLTGLPNNCGCKVDTHCPNELVCDGTSGVCKECVDSNDCASTAYCDGNDSCKSKSGYTGPCTTNVQCLSDQCGVPGFPNSCGCLVDGDCGGGLSCDTADHICKPCVDADDCAAGQWCNASDSCQPQKAYFTICEADVECFSDRCGLTGGPGTCLCSTTADCPAGTCSTTEGLCQ